VYLVLWLRFGLADGFDWIMLFVPAEKTVLS
jgi:hypothetical protein